MADLDAHFRRQARPILHIRRVARAHVAVADHGDDRRNICSVMILNESSGRAKQVQRILPVAIPAVMHGGRAGVDQPADGTWRERVKH